MIQAHPWPDLWAPVKVPVFLKSDWTQMLECDVHFCLSLLQHEAHILLAAMCTSTNFRLLSKHEPKVEDTDGLVLPGSLALN